MWSSSYEPWKGIGQEGSGQEIVILRRMIREALILQGIVPSCGGMGLGSGICFWLLSASDDILAESKATKCSAPTPVYAEPGFFSHRRILEGNIYKKYIKYTQVSEFLSQEIEFINNFMFQRTLCLNHRERCFHMAYCLKARSPLQVVGLGESECWLVF